MDVVSLVLLVAAVVCFALAAGGVAGRKVNLVALGLAFFALVPLLAMIK